MSAIITCHVGIAGLPTFVIRLRVLFLYVAPGCRFDAPVLAIAGGFACRHFGASLVPEPVAPFRPPASRNVLCGIEPAIGVGPGCTTDPMTALVFRRGIDYASDVPAGTEYEGRVVGKEVGRRVCGGPRHEG